MWVVELELWPKPQPKLFRKFNALFLVFHILMIICRGPRT
ncbi:hypothetical protein Patl1_02353 [Pistacia atlantica]|uniref:Uncharacterized protein n=1 Tax=Pistacia atlantica TaxID=434234 RepID=A0ACC1C542_9ROSI|nr:hypothetical protein Patl1_02353 [Pistacia atlantica]